MKAMEAVFDRFIRVPKMIYGTRRLLFRHFIEQHGAEIEETELSALTIIADKYSVNDIKTVCRRVLTSHRVKRNKVSHLWIFSSCEEKVFSGNHPRGGVLMDLENEFSARHKNDFIITCHDVDHRLNCFSVCESSRNCNSTF